jgi:tetratricopeptide (TPR) repeat protein
VSGGILLVAAWLAGAGAGASVEASGAPVAEASPAEQWALANAAFRAGRFDEAVSRYEGLAALGVDDGELWYNLGNARLRRGELAPANAAYRAAQARLPRGEDVEANLRFARARVQDSVAPPEPSPVLRAVFFWHWSLSERELAVAATVASALLWLALGAWLLARQRWARWPALVAGVLAVALVPSLVVRLSSSSAMAVVGATEASVRSAAAADGVVLFRVHTGVEALVTGREEGWVRVRLSDGKQGWVPEGDVLLVRL